MAAGSMLRDPCRATLKHWKGQQWANPPATPALAAFRGTPLRPGGPPPPGSLRGMPRRVADCCHSHDLLLMDRFGISHLPVSSFSPVYPESTNYSACMQGLASESAFGETQTMKYGSYCTSGSGLSFPLGQQPLHTRTGHTGSPRASCSSDL